MLTVSFEDDFTFSSSPSTEGFFTFLILSLWLGGLLVLEGKVGGLVRGVFRNHRIGFHEFHTLSSVLWGDMKFQWIGPFAGNDCGFSNLKDAKNPFLRRG